ncbi:protein abrupt isoform X2 [Anabrus simplex]|uniref:protein abrupt isoform X2 n=1 Tax=Anabrus simplex TaxID=316456 RepID=UPI0035A39D11
MATDQFCLRWNNFQVNITSALESLKCDEDLVDVTLTCDGQNVKAHKVILSACSPYFRNLFRENPCQHPIVILKDVSYEDVTALLNFMYQGEVYITQDRLAPFLHTAELLQVRGLAGATNPFKESQPPSLQQPPHQPKQQQHQPKLKKSTPLSAGQLRRVTPPLSISPSIIPHHPSSKPLPYTPSYRTAKSPLVSPTSKDTHSATISTLHLKEKSVALPHSFSVQNRESDLKLSLSQSNVSCTSVSNYPSSNEQSTTSSYAALPEQQPYSSGQSHSAAFQQHASELSPTFPPIPSDEPSSSQPSSPQPTSTKRRKAFPRRLSSGSSSHIPTGDEPEHPKEASADEFEVVKVVPPIVKQEPVDGEDLEGDAHDDVDTTSRQSADSEDMEVTGFYAQSNAESEEPVSLEQNIVKEEAATEGSSEVSPHSMLLRSLAGVQVQQSDDRFMSRPCPLCNKIISNKSNLLKHMRIRHSGVCKQQCCPACKKVFKNKYSLKVHMHTYHRTDHPQQESESISSHTSIKTFPSFPVTSVYQSQSYLTH